MLSNTELSAKVKGELQKLCSALDSRAYDAAMQIQVAHIVTTSFSVAANQTAGSIELMLTILRNLILNVHLHGQKSYTRAELVCKV